MEADIKTTLISPRKNNFTIWLKGSQFTCEGYVNLLKENNIKISIDGKSRALDNQRIDRFFRNYKLEKLYIEECETGHQRHVTLPSRQWGTARMLMPAINSLT